MDVAHYAAIDTATYRDSLTTLLRNKGKSGLTDDPKFVAGAQRVLDFMHDNWQRQKLCDVVISAKNGDLQVCLFTFRHIGLSFICIVVCSQRND